LQGRLSAPPEQFQRVSSMCHRGWWRVGSCATTDNARKWADLPCFLLPFPSLLAVRTTVTCKGEKNTIQSFRFSHFFRSTLFCRLLFRVFCSSLLQVAGLPASSALPLCIDGGPFSDLFHFRSPLLLIHLISDDGRSGDWRRELSVWVAAKAGMQKMKKNTGCLGWSVAVVVEETEGEANVFDEEGNATAGGLGFGGDLLGKGGWQLAFIEAEWVGACERERLGCVQPWEGRESEGKRWPGLKV